MLFRSATGMLATVFDIPRIFMHIARLLGAKNAQDFVRMNPMMPVQMQDEQVMSEAQKGNMVPVGGMPGAQLGAEAQGAA